MPQQREWHLITGEFPPQVGGVSDHTRHLAGELANDGAVVHVWAPMAPGSAESPAGVFLRRELGRMSPADLRRAGAQLDSFQGPRRLLVQWVPHAYGYRSMNLGFCLWLLGRARRGDEIDLMVHEPFLAFREGSRRQDAVAVVHRAMMLTLLWATRRVWVSTPAWMPKLRPYILRKDTTLCWLPIASNVRVSGDASAVAVVRRRYAGPDVKLVGHFGTFGRLVEADLGGAIVRLLEQTNDVNVLLLGNGGPRVLQEWTERCPAMAARVHATGYLESHALSEHLQACDVMLQPYPDGVTARRTSVLAALAHDIPVVTTSGHLTEGFWTDGTPVALVRARDVHEMAKRVAELLGDVTERVALGLSGGQLYRTSLGIDHAITALRASWGPTTEGRCTSAHTAREAV